jgi:hypothetical protein
MAVIIKVASEELPRPRNFVPDLPLQVERIVRKALEKNAEDRFATMKEFADLLEKIAAGQIPSHEQFPELPVEASPPNKLEKSRVKDKAAAGKSGKPPAGGANTGKTDPDNIDPGTPPTFEKRGDALERSFDRRSTRWFRPALYSLGGIVVVGALFYGILLMLGQLPANSGVHPTATNTVEVARVDPTSTPEPPTAMPSWTSTPEPTATSKIEPTATPTISPTPTMIPTITPKAGYFDVAISEVMANPCGGEKEQQANEYIELYNYGDSAVDVSDWYIFVTGQLELPDPLVDWETRNPGTKVGNAITNTTVILPKQYALILQPGYLTVESGHPQEYDRKIPASTVILTIGDVEVRLGNKANGIISSGKGVTRDAIFLYRGETRHVINKVSTYGIYSIGSDPSVYAQIPGMGLEAQKCQTVVRKFPSLPDDISNWQVLQEASPGY